MTTTRVASVLRRAAPDLIVCAAYVVMTLAMTYPLVTAFGSTIPGDRVDGCMFLWNDWWTKHALSTPGEHLYFTKHVFYPDGVPLLFHTLVPLNGLLSIPLQAAFGLVAAHNLLIVFSFVLSGYGAYRLALRLTPRPSAAFVGGVVFTFCSFKFGHLLGHVNLTSTEWIPLFVLFMLRAYEASSARRAAVEAAVAGVFFACNVYTEYTYALFVGLVTLVYLVDRAASMKRDAILVRPFAAATVVLGLSAAVAVAPLVYVAVKDHVSVAVPPNSGADTFIADLAAYVLPSPFHPLLGRIPVALGVTGERPADATVSLGYSALALVVAAFALRATRAKGFRFYTVTFVVFAVLALGPHLHVLGVNTRVPLPFAVVDHIPLLRNVRAPSRLVVLVALSAAVLSAAGLDAIVRRWTSTPRGARALTAGALFFVTFELWPAPFPMEPLSVPNVYAPIIADRDDDAAVLEVPIGWRSGFQRWFLEEPKLLYYQTSHRKLMFGGSVARLPRPDREIIDAYLKMPVVHRIALIEVGAPPLESRFYGDERVYAMRFLAFYKVHWVVVHAPFIGTNVHKYVVDCLPVEEVARDEQTIVYRVVLPAVIP